MTTPTNPNDPTTLTGAASADLLGSNPAGKVLIYQDPATYPAALTSGGLLVSNTYWIAPAKWFRPAWDYFKQEPEPGAWQIESNGGRRRQLTKLEDAPKKRKGSWTATLAELTIAGRYTTPLEPVEIAGRRAYVPGKNPGDWLALATDPDGNHVPILHEFLAPLSSGQPSYGYRYEGAPILRQRPGGPFKPVGIFLPRIHVIDAHYEGDPGSPDRRYVGTQEIPEGPKLAAVVMPQRALA
jgi:hypothetical protein